MRLHLQTVVTVAIAAAAAALLFVAIDAPAATAIDPTSAIRGSLGASLEDLSLSDNVGRLSLLLNGGSALLFGAFASLAVTGPHRHRIKKNQHQGDAESLQTLHFS